ncbi:MAG: hypothetical protein ACRDSZ_20415 [Pseudonocardiaceae bacterium]
MPTTVPNQHGSHPAGSTTSAPGVNAVLQLSTRTVAWLTDHPAARQFVGSVWDKLTELERSGQYPGAIDALRRVLIHHQPTAAGRCRHCRRVTGRRRPFPCIVWHQIRFDLLGLFAGSGRHRPFPVADRSTAEDHRLVYPGGSARLG